VEAAVLKALRGRLGAWVATKDVRNTVAPALGLSNDMASKEMKALTRRCAAGYRLPGGLLFEIRGANTISKEYRLSAPGGEEAGGGEAGGGEEAGGNEGGGGEGGGSSDDDEGGGGGQQAGRSATPMGAEGGGGALAPVQAAVVSLLAGKPGAWVPSAKVRDAVCSATGLTPGYVRVRLRDVALLPLPGGWRLEAKGKSCKAYRLVAAAAGASPPAPTIDGSLTPRRRVEAAAVAFLKARAHGSRCNLCRRRRCPPPPLRAPAGSLPRPSPARRALLT
jgi:hypothetical protein